ncbi:hypothetical protein CC2G_003987 [Coprinopsis cinerea AmutBmut pab1-1]|nr:hypothetical protein CC2G_003987 [Coprinopsis cinerea AmutBmut pab1-1]
MQLLNRASIFVDECSFFVLWARTTSAGYDEGIRQLKKRRPKAKFPRGLASESAALARSKPYGEMRSLCALQWAVSQYITIFLDSAYLLLAATSFKLKHGHRLCGWPTI